MHPADDYVAEFVAEHGGTAADAPRVQEDETLSTLIRLAIDADAPIVVQDNGADVGVVTRREILQTVIEGTEVS